MWTKKRKSIVAFCLCLAVVLAQIFPSMNIVGATKTVEATETETVKTGETTKAAGAAEISLGAGATQAEFDAIKDKKWDYASDSSYGSWLITSDGNLLIGELTQEADGKWKITKQAYSSYLIDEDCAKDSDGKSIGIPKWLHYRQYIKTAEIKIEGLISGAYLLYDCPNLTNVDLSLMLFGNEYLKSMEFMFYKCTKLTNVHFDTTLNRNQYVFNTSQVTNMNSMFAHCTSLKNIDLTVFNTSAVTNMSSMFENCSSLTSLTLNDTTFKTDAVTNMHSMFAGCGLTIADVSKFNTDKVTDMGSMFANCPNLTGLTLGANFHINSVTDMSFMFANCKKLFTSGGSPSISFTIANSNGNTSVKTNAESMFAGCDFTTLNLSSFNTSQVTDMSSMFKDCSKLTTLTFDGSFNTNQVTDMSSMFENCTALTAFTLGDFDTSSVTHMSLMFSNSGLNSFTLSNSNTSKVTDMGSMFKDCASLKTLDLGAGFDISAVTDMSAMFSGCKLLFSDTTNPSLTFKITNGEIKPATDVTSMFSGCTGLTTLNLSAFDTKNVTDMDSMFEGCSGLTTLTLGGSFDTSNVAHMNAMFKGCSSLSKVDVGTAFNISSVTEMRSMFENCSKLFTDTSNPSVDFSKFTITAGTTANTLVTGMFSGCEFTELDLSNFNTSNVTDMVKMFENCSKLTKLTLGGEFKTNRVTTMNSMFIGCTGLTKLDLGSFNGTNVNYMTDMFANCSNLKELTLGGGFKDKNRDLVVGLGSLEKLNLASTSSAVYNLPKAGKGFAWYDVENEGTESEIKTLCESTTAGRTKYRKTELEDVNDYIYMDSACTTLAPRDYRVQYVNGGTVKQTDNTKKNYKTKEYYTKLVPTDIKTTNSKGKETTIKGKRVVGITLSNATPAIDPKKKIISANDTTPAKYYASATINSKGLIKVTAKNQPGTVYLWVLDTNAPTTNYACAQITIKAAPSMMQIFTPTYYSTIDPENKGLGSKDEAFKQKAKNAYKKDSIELGKTIDLYLYPSYQGWAAKATDRKWFKTDEESATYTISETVPKKDPLPCFEVKQPEPNSNPYHFTVTALKLYKDKKVSRSIVVQCNENGRKVSFTATAVNSVKGITVTAGKDLQVDPASSAAVAALTVQRSDAEKKTGTFTISTSRSDDSTSVTTDTVKLYAMGKADGFDEEKMKTGKFKLKDAAKVSKDQRAITAKLGKDKTTVTVTAARKAKETFVYYLIMYNNKTTDGYQGYKVVKLSTAA